MSFSHDRGEIKAILGQFCQLIWNINKSLKLISFLFTLWINIPVAYDDLLYTATSPPQSTAFCCYV